MFWFNANVNCSFLMIIWWLPSPSNILGVTKKFHWTFLSFWNAFCCFSKKYFVVKRKVQASLCLYPSTPLFSNSPKGDVLLVTPSHLFLKLLVRCFSSNVLSCSILWAGLFCWSIFTDSVQQTLDIIDFNHYKCSRISTKTDQTLSFPEQNSSYRCS